MKPIVRGVRRRGFTLVEMLVVIGIIVLLVGILLPTVMSIRRNAEKNAVRMELHTIGLALDAYKADFGDYPRPPNDKRKYRVLAWALIGPYDTTPIANATDPLAGNTPLLDGADGPGFRTSWDYTLKKGTKVFGPYLAPDKFRVATAANNLDFPTTPAELRWDILDRYGSPIEYFPRWRNYQPGMNLFGTVAASPPTTAAVYDLQQQWIASPTATPASNNPAVVYFRKALGDDDLSDVINGSEAIQETPPFLLLSRGPLRAFSATADIQNPSKFPKTEEITNLQH